MLVLMLLKEHESSGEDGRLAYRTGIGAKEDDMAMVAMQAEIRSEKLSGTDMNELRWFFAEPPPASVEGHVAAQSYDPKGSGVYDPSQDLTLERILQKAVAKRESTGESNWERIARILRRVRDGKDGGLHIEVLQNAFDNRYRVASLEGSDVGGFEHPAVALLTRTAMDLGLAIAREEEHHQRLETAMLSARRDHCSPMSCAIRVLEADARVCHPSDALIRASVFRALARAVREKDADTLAMLRGEENTLLVAAGTTYRVARRELGADRKTAKAAKEKAADAAWDAYVTGKRVKEAARIEARLKRVT